MRRIPVMTADTASVDCGAESFQIVQAQSFCCAVSLDGKPAAEAEGYFQHVGNSKVPLGGKLL